LLSRGRGRISQELATILLCHDMKWDYFTYINQPSWFISGLMEKTNIDTKYQNQENKRRNKINH